MLFLSLCCSLVCVVPKLVLFLILYCSSALLFYSVCCSSVYIFLSLYFSSARGIPQNVFFACVVSTLLLSLSCSSVSAVPKPLLFLSLCCSRACVVPQTVLFLSHWLCCSVTTVVPQSGLYFSLYCSSGSVVPLISVIFPKLLKPPPSNANACTIYSDKPLYL